MNDELHAQVENFNIHQRVKIIMHCLIELGVVTKLECTYENCKMPYHKKRFTPMRADVIAAIAIVIAVLTWLFPQGKDN